MINPKNPKERNLVKGAIRRVFSRSDLRREAINLSRIEHTDSKHPRVTKWSRCTECQQPTPTYKMEVDHKIPVIPLDKPLEDMTWDDLVNRIWCDISNLKPMCKPCHKLKSKAEQKERREWRKKLKST